MVVCDASPLIILAKLDRLDLLPRLLNGSGITILSCVAGEVLSDRAGVVERRRLEAFFGSCAEIVEFAESDFASRALSRSDQFTLTFCVRHSIDWLGADDRVLRRIAAANGVAVIGALGILVGASKKNLLTTSDAKCDLQRAVAEHGVRISVALYQRVLEELDRGDWQ